MSCEKISCAQAFALRSQIEIAVTLLIIVLFRQLGIVKETKEFTWGEIMAEAQSTKSLEKEMQELLELRVALKYVGWPKDGLKMKIGPSTK